MKNLYICSLIIFFSSCATIFKGSTQTISIDSNVKGADVVLDGVTLGKTPFIGKIKRASSATITLKKEGYFTKTI